MLRHGKTAYNHNGCYLGKTDAPLTETGRQEILKFAGKLALPTVDICVVSPLIRCVQTAELIWPDCRKLPVKEFEEIDFGLWEGKNYRDLSGDPKYQYWIDHNGEPPFPGGESRSDFILRVYRGYERMLKLFGGEAPEEAGPFWGTHPVKAGDEREQIKTLGMVVHGGTIMALLSTLLGGDYYAYQVPCCCGFSFWLNLADSTISEVQKLVD